MWPTQQYCARPRVYKSSAVVAVRRYIRGLGEKRQQRSALSLFLCTHGASVCVYRQAKEKRENLAVVAVVLKG